MSPLIFNLDSDPSLFDQLAQLLGAERGALEQRRFPDDENYLRLHSHCQQRDTIIFCNLYRPDDKILRLIFLADALREQGAARILLVTPYLPYMRQDKAFNPGECISSRPFAKLLSATVDGLITIDPHLHRYRSLAEIYTLRSQVVAAAPLIAHWIANHICEPLLIGPDSESAQWVSEVAQLAQAPFEILRKTRLGDRQVEISPLSQPTSPTTTPILIDDIISSGHTMLETLQRLPAGLQQPVCIGVHGIFSGDAYHQLSQHARVITSDCIPHPSNQIETAPLLANAVRTWLDEGSHASA